MTIRLKCENKSCDHLEGKFHDPDDAYDYLTNKDSGSERMCPKCNSEMWYDYDKYYYCYIPHEDKPQKSFQIIINAEVEPSEGSDGGWNDDHGTIKELENSHDSRCQHEMECRFKFTGTEEECKKHLESISGFIYSERMCNIFIKEDLCFADHWFHNNPKESEKFKDAKFILDWIENWRSVTGWS